jgi:hypothetical protein
MADFGFTTWDEQVNAPKKDYKNSPKIQWMRFAPGSNLIRFVTPPAKYNIFKVPAGGKFGTKVKSAFPVVDRVADPGVIAGLRPKKRYYAGILHRATDGTTFKVVDLSPLIFEQLQMFKDDFGEPTNFDVNVKYNPDAPASSKYGVIPRPATPLTDADREAIDKVGMDNVRDYITRICTPATVDQVTKALKDLGWDGSAGFWTPETNKKEDLEDASEDDFNFSR